MSHLGHTGRRRLGVVGLLTVPLLVAAGMWAGSALGAGTAQPSMEVLPSPTGLKYGQTVDVKGHNLPKGSGSVAVTICGLQDASGQTLANPGADDCAGAPELGKLVVVKSWSSNGEFDSNYTLPQSGEKFGKNSRFCDATHHCAVVVADANPSNPAYHVQVVIQFVDQQPFGSTPTTAPGGSSTTAPGGSSTTAPSTPGSTTPASTTPTTASTPATAPPVIGLHGSFSGSAGPDGGSFEFGGGGSFNPPSGGPALPAPPAPSLPPLTLPAPPANPIPAPVASALDQVCTQLAAAVTQAGGDPSALTAACGAIESGNGPQELALVLQSPSLLCVEGASLWQNNAQITAACNQAATALTPVTSQLGGALAPVLGAL